MGDFAITLTAGGGAGENTHYTYADSVLILTADGSYTVGMRGGVTKTTNTIVVAANVNATVTLNGVSINASADDDGCAFALENGATVILVLQGANTLRSGGDRAGLHAPEGTALTIEGTPGDSLEAYGGHFSAGIGGSLNSAGGTIIIHGGTIKAQGDAGIGGGYSGAGGSVTIYGGTVTAQGQDAGIGGGYNGAGGSVTIHGGTITARGTAAGIGGGHRGAGGSIIVHGGVVAATSSMGGAGIGAGASHHGTAAVTITGGTVTATGGAGASAAAGTAPAPVRSPLPAAVYAAPAKAPTRRLPPPTAPHRLTSSPLQWAPKTHRKPVAFSPHAASAAWPAPKRRTLPPACTASAMCTQTQRASCTFGCPKHSRALPFRCAPPHRATATRPRG